MQTASNVIEIKKLRMDLVSVEKQMSDVMDGLMNYFTMKYSLAIYLKMWYCQLIRIKKGTVIV